MGGPSPEMLASSGTEAAQQTALFCWAALPDVRRQYPELEWMFHCPNGGTRDKIEAGHLKAQGVKRGVPDVLLPVARWGKCGLWIELKVGSNQTSPDQKRWIKGLTQQNFAVVVAYSWVIAKDYIIQYLEDGNERHKNTTFSPDAYRPNLNSCV